MNIMSRVRALLVASHPGPCLAITAMASLLAAQAAPHGAGPALIVPAMLAGQVSVGWSNDAFDAERDAAAHRTDKPIATGQVSRRAVWIAAFTALAAAIAMSLAISVATLAVNAVIIGTGWAYNAGLKTTPWSGLMFIVGSGQIPAYATTWLPGHPLPRWWVTVAAAAIGLGSHFANVLPDLAGDRLAGVKGLPQRVAVRWGGTGVRAVAITLLLLASVSLLVAARPARRWVAVAGLAVSCVLAVVSARGKGRVPFRAAIGIALVDVLLFVADVGALT
jgi:4-hydroxybenzoate polyprenyltransferase